MENTGNEPKDLLSDETNELMQFTYASHGERFLNWLIDNIVMRFTISYLSSYGIVYLLSLISPPVVTEIANRNLTTLFVLTYFVAIFNYLCYYTVMEKLFNGRTVGKFITATRAVKIDGSELAFRDALLRSLCRLIPFEPLSGFGTLWHDAWTNTMVIKTKNY